MWFYRVCDEGFVGLMRWRALRASGLGCLEILIWGFPKIRGAILGVPIIRIVVYWGPY